MRNSFVPLAAIIVVLGTTTLWAQQTRRATRPQARSAAEQQQQLEEDKAAIEKLHDEDIQASIALDVPALESLWTDDIVSLPPGEPAVVGREANSKRLEDGVAKLKSTEVMGYNEQWQEVRIQGDWAYEWGTISGRLRPFTGGEETSYTYHVMRILNRQPDGTWKIARSIYNDANPAPAKAEEPKKPEEPKGNPLKD